MRRSVTESPRILHVIVGLLSKKAVVGPVREAGEISAALCPHKEHAKRI